MLKFYGNHRKKPCLTKRNAASDRLTRGLIDKAVKKVFKSTEDLCCS